PGKSIHALNHNNKQLKQKVKKLQQSRDRVIHKVQKLNGSVVQFKCKHRQRISRIRAMARRPPELKKDDIKT
ncbi:21998_t:CDS:1, partial [Cetraspora pellucida]